MSPEIVELDVGGRVFKTTLQTLLSYPDSTLGRMFSGQWSNSLDKNGRVFIDRNGDTFEFILEFLRQGPLLALPADRMILERIKHEAVYFALTELSKLLDEPKQEVKLKFCTPQPYNFKETCATVGQLKSDPDSIFSDLSKLHKNIDDECYVIDCADTLSTQGAFMVVEFLKFGKDAFLMKPEIQRPEVVAAFHTSAKRFNVAQAVKYACELERINEKQTKNKYELEHTPPYHAPWTYGHVEGDMDFGIP